jgi:hypothetical protein
LRPVDHVRRIQNKQGRPANLAIFLTKLELYRGALRCGGIKRYIGHLQPFRIT